MGLSFRNLTITPDAPVLEWPTEAVQTAMERGDLGHWRRIIAEFRRDPWGRTARQVEEILSHSRPYGVADLMEMALQRARERVETDEKNEVAAEIRRAVSASGLGQAEFAAGIGTSASRLSTYMSGKVTPSAALMVRIRRLIKTENGSARAERLAAPELGDRTERAGPTTCGSTHGGFGRPAHLWWSALQQLRFGFSRHYQPEEQAVEYRFLGRTGLKVSELCLGAMHFGGRAEEPESVRILDRFVEAGGNFIDTADIYNAGESEKVIGRWLKNRDRDDLVIATKVWGSTGDGPNDVGLSRKHILSGVEASLRRLGTDYIDLYYTHLFDDGAPLEETLAALDTLVTSGKVRYLGASNVAGWQLQKAIDLSHHHGLARYEALQPLYNLIDRETEWELLAVCRNEGLGVMPWSPLRAGWLSGRFERGMTEPPAGSRIAEAGEHGYPERWENYDNERTWNIIDALHGLATETGRTVAQIAVRWLMQVSGVTAPIIGPRSIEQLTDNLGAVGWELTPGQVDELTTVSHRTPVYPYQALASARRR